MTTDPGSGQARFAGAHLTGSAYPDDDGSADPAVAAALSEHSAGGPARDVQQALLGTRLLVPVVAMLEESEVSVTTGMQVDKQSAMATVTVVGANGKRALPVFTSMVTMIAWRSDARPSAVSAEYAAAAAMHDADALLIDPAGPHRLLLAGAGLRALAAGRPWLPLREDAELAHQLNQAVADLGVRVSVLDSDSSDNDADLVVQAGGTDAELTDVITHRLIESTALRERVDRGVRIRFERHAGR